MRRVGFCSLFAALSAVIGLAALAASEPASLFSLTAQITLPNVHGHFARWDADLSQSRVFVAASENDSMEVLDLRTRTSLASITGVKEPQGVAYAKSTGRIFATSAADDTLRSFDASTFKPVSTVQLGPNADGLRMDNLQDRLYAASGDGAISAFDASGKRLAVVRLSAHPAEFVLAQNAPRLYATLPGSRSIAVIDSAAMQLVAEWPIKQGCENDALAIDEDRRRLFVACRIPAKLLTFDMETGKPLASQPIVTDVTDLLHDPVHSRLYALTGSGYVAAYAQETADHFTKIETLAIGAGSRTALFVPEWNILFVGVPDFAGHPAEIRLYQPH